jgi:alcohol dehydrogenase class IV
MSPGSFAIGRIPRIDFGAGAFERIPALVSRYGKRVLLVTGARSFPESDRCRSLVSTLRDGGGSVDHVRVAGEPSPQLIDDAVREYGAHEIDVVLAVGGGSALDAGKAIAGLLRVGRPVSDYLEGVGPELPYTGPAVPLIAVPTTAGTGSEATRNAVLSVRGKDGYKKSFRDEKLVAQYAVVDPDLLASCPREVIAANGMDALTQLIESCVSARANVFTNSLAFEGLKAARAGLLPLYEGTGEQSLARERMAYAALVSGITLAHVGLGSVHGLASPLGAFYPIPHGVACGTLVARATAVNIAVMREREPDNPGLESYAAVATILCERGFETSEAAGSALVDLLDQWTTRMDLPRLSAYGIDTADLDRIVAHSRGSSMKTNPVVLTDAEIRSVLEPRL